MRQLMYRHRECNVGRLDRVLRAGIGVVLIYIGFIDSDLIGATLIALLVGVLGMINLVAAVSGFCPVYKLAGLNTHQRDNADSR